MRFWISDPIIMESLSKEDAKTAIECAKNILSVYETETSEKVIARPQRGRGNPMGLLRFTRNDTK
jgi:hypothetical protein